MVIPSLLALIFYLLAGIAALHNLLAVRARLSWQLLASAGAAMVLHGLALVGEIIGLEAGQDLSLLNVASFVSLLISLFMTLICRRFNGWSLLPVAYGFAALLLVVNYLIPSHYVIHLEQHPQVLLHIGLALMAFSVLMMASLFTLLLAYLDHHLKSRKRLSLQTLPPLLTLERRVYQLILLGVLLLTLSIGSGFFFLQDLFAQGKAHKAVLSMMAWVVYVLLLWGHHRHGWRGKTLIGLSLLGSLLLVLAYFGSRFVKEVLLG